ncbi:MAG: SPOR domain-containing protein [Pseudomonadales bacterium]
MKFGNLIIGVGILSLSACSQVVVDREIRTSDAVPPLSVVNTEPAPVLEPVVDVALAPTPARQPTFADLSPSAWVVQIAAVKSLDEIEQIEASNRQLRNTLHIPTRDSELGDLHAVLVGVYSTEADAEEIADALPPKVAGDEPWIRSVASVQAVMR